MSDVNFRASATDVDEKRALPSHYAASSGNFLPTFRDNLSGPIFKDQESQQKTWPSKMTPDNLSRNVGKKLALLAA
jgi:hypothetical protein